MKILQAQKKHLNEIVKIFMTESKKKPYLQSWTKKSATNDLEPFIKKKEIWVAIIEEHVAGFIIAGATNWNKKITYISEFWVTEKLQGQGIGKKLITFIEDYYKKKGVREVSLLSYNKSKAFGFYKKLNYLESKEATMLVKKLK